MEPQTVEQSAEQFIPSANATLTKKQKYETGKELRKKVSRSSHGSWEPQHNRFDPVELIIHSSEGRIESLLPIRYARMMQSAFSFYRGAAAIMAADLFHTPSSGIRTQLCGDCHLMNFGGFATPERNLVFDINDFDETNPGPWEWDLKRLAASFAIACEWRNFSAIECKKIAWQVVKSYQQHMEEFCDLSVLQIWYTQLDLTDLVASNPDKEIRKLNEQMIKKAKETAAHDKEFAKLTYLQDNRARIKDNPPLIYHPDDDTEKKILSRAANAFKKYAETLPADKKALLGRYSLQDVAIKVVGVGSVGNICGIALFMSDTGEPIFLQFKQARASVLEEWTGRSEFNHHGERVVMGQKMIQSASDMFLGWTTGEEGRQFYIRQLNDTKVKPVLEVKNQKNMADYATACGWALARAHARTSDPNIISGYIGRSDAFPDAISDFSMAYAEQNEKDYQKMLQAIRAGKIEVKQE